MTIPSAELQEIVASKAVEIVMGGNGNKGKFNTTVIEGFEEGQSIGLTGLNDDSEGTDRVSEGDETVYKVKLSSF